MHVFLVGSHEQKQQSLYKLRNLTFQAKTLSQAVSSMDEEK